MTDNGLNEKIEEIRIKNVQMKETLSTLQAENAKYKKRYEVLKHLLEKLTNHVQRNVQIFEELADDMNGVLRMSRASSLISPISKKSILLQPKNVDVPISSTPITVQIPETPQPESSSTPVLNSAQTKFVTRRKIPIEPINLQELNATAEAEGARSSDPQNTEESFEEELSIILEDDEEEETVVREVSVHLKRLPRDVMEAHLNKLSNSVNTSNSNVGVFLSSSANLDNSNTPLKLHLMEQLELLPVLRNPSFISIRKKERITRSNPLSMSPKKHRPSPLNAGKVKEILSIKKDSLSSVKKENLSPKAKKTKKSNSVQKSLSLKHEKSPARKTKAVREKSSSEERLSPNQQVKENFSAQKSPLHTPPKEKKGHKSRKKNKEGNTVLETGRLSKRRARPLDLKEISLRKKLRRS